MSISLNSTLRLVLTDPVASSLNVYAQASPSCRSESSANPNLQQFSNIRLQLRGPRVLPGLVELDFVGSILAKMEQASACESTSPVASKRADH